MFPISFQILDPVPGKDFPRGDREIRNFGVAEVNPFCTTREDFFS